MKEIEREDYVKEAKTIFENTTYAEEGKVLKFEIIRRKIELYPIESEILENNIKILNCEKYLKSYIVKDIWGNEVDVRNIDMILTESSLKFWNSYTSSEDYINQYRSHGYGFRVIRSLYFAPLKGK